MKAKKIELWIKSLGLPYSTLISEGIISDQPLTELYKGRDWLTLKPDSGVELSFSAQTRRFERLFITLIQTVEDQTVYRGALPYPMASKMTQSDVHAAFGPPSQTSEPRKIPTIGIVGGHDAYPLDTSIHPSGQVMFQYTADLQVKTLFFTLI
jgi:hypothetical protein